MKDKNHNSRRSMNDRWFRLGFSVTLAFSLALLLFLIPVTAGSVVQIPVPTWSPLNSAPGSPASDSALHLLMPIGASLVRATDGLTITKTAPAFVDQGGTITYTLVVTNNTTQHITDAIVSDFLPSNTSCGSTHIEPPPATYPRWGFSCVPPVAGWVMFYNPFVFPISFTIGTSNTLIFTVDVDEPLPDGARIVNDNYRVDANNDTLSDIGLPFTTTVRAPNWAITKTVSSSTIEPGQYLTYTITITNNGRLPTSGPYTVTDQLPAATDPATVQIQPPGILSDTTVTWVFSDTMLVDVPRTLTFSVRVRSPLPDTIAIVNQNYQVTGGNVYSPAVGPPVTVTVDAPATLSIAKTVDPDPVQAGDQLTYTITITNNATSLGPVWGVVVTDTLPAELFDQAGGFVGTAAGVVTDTGNPVTWALTHPINVGELAQLTVTTRVTSPLLPQNITNTFEASSGNAPLVSGTLTSAVSATNVITLNKTVSPAVVAPGDSVTYTITLTNSGNSIAAIDLADVLHPDFTPSTYDTSLTLPGRTPFTTEAITTVVFSADAPLTPGTYDNQVVTATYDLTRATISNIAPVHVVSGLISLAKAANVSVAEIGETITYTYYITNSGDITLTAISLVDDPLGDITLGATELGPTDSTTGTATTVVSETDMPGPIVNTATVTATYLANNLVTTSTTESVVISYTNTITVAKSYETSGGVPADIGDTITYTYRITNTGTVTFTTIELNDDKLGPIPVTPSILRPDEGTVATGTTVVVESDLPGPLVNLVTVTGTHIYVGEAVATNTASIPLTYTAAITVAKSYETSDGVPARIGDTITYTYRITNTGPVALTNIELNDDKLGDIPVSPATLGPRVGTEVTATTTVVESDLTTLQLVNIATLTGTNPAGPDAGATGTASVPLTYTLGITINKTASQGIAALGDRITYTYRVTNTGELTLTSVTLSDDVVPFNNIEITINLPPDTGFTYIATYLINQGDLPGPITNIATVTGTNSFVSDSSTATDTATVLLTYNPAITLEKTANTSNATIGDIITYTYRITNNGDIDLNDVTLVDDRLRTLLSGGIVLAGFSYPPVIIPYTVTYSDLLNEYPTLTNTATVTAGNNIDPSIVSATDTATVTLTYNSDIHLTKAANVTLAAVGETITYTYAITNTGNITLTNIILFDDRLGSLTGNLGATTLAPNADSITATATYVVQSDDMPAVTNTAIVTGDDSLGSLVTASASFTVDVEEPITAIAATNSSPTIVGNTTYFTVTTNTSSGVIYTWNFGDGSANQSGQFVDRDYPAIGVYTAIVTASNRVSIISSTTVVTITAGPPAAFELQATSPQTAGVPFNITITAVDQFGNPTDFDGPVTISDDTGTINPTTVTLVNGTVTPSFVVTTSTSPDFDTITAISGTISGSVDVEILPAAPDDILVTVEPSPLRICQSAVSTVTVVDQFGNGVPDEAVTWGTFGASTITPTGASGDTDQAGLFTVAVQGVSEGSTTILAQHGTVGTASTSINVNGPPIPGAINLSISPATVEITGSAVVTATVSDCNGPAAGIVVTFTVDSLANISPLTATTNASGIATTTVLAGPDLGTATITGTVEGSVFDTITLNIVAPVSPIFLPIVMKSLSVAPDLIVSFSLDPPNPAAGQDVLVTVVITNVGTAPTGDGFWVDFYINPDPPPTTGNQRWDELDSTVSPKQGIAWAVPAPGLAPGQRRILTSDGSSGLAPSAPHTIWDDQFYSGTQHLYVFVDSFSMNGSPNGGILESNETNNRYELHFVSPLAGGPEIESSGVSEPLELPPRWDP